jgi:hypothetical protein
MTRILTALTTVFILFFAQLASAQCTCIYVGGRVNEGETACIWSAKGKTMARCEKVLNVTSWKNLEQACPVEQSLKPATFPLPQSAG